MGPAGRFFLLVIVLTMPLWALGGDRRLLTGLGIGLPASSLMLLAPFVATIVLVGRENGWPGVRDVVRSTFPGRDLGGRWLILTLGVPPLIYGVSYLGHLLSGRVSDLDLALRSPVVLAVLFWAPAAAEEVGWPGYATASLLRTRTALGAALVVGVVWASVHVVPDIQAGRDWLWILGQRTHTVALRVLIVWLFVNTGRTLAAPVFFHALDNVAVFSLFPGNEGYEPAFTAVATLAVAVAVVTRYGSRTLTRRSGGGDASRRST